MLIKHFDSLKSLRDFWIVNAPRKDDETRLDWYGNEDRNHTIRCSEFGDTSLVPQAERLMEELTQAVHVDRKVPEDCMAGGWVNVPAYVAGRPIHMRKMAHVDSEYAPVRVYVELSCWSGCPAATIRNRGVATLALVMQLLKVRPVQLYITCVMGRHGNTHAYSRYDFNGIDDPKFETKDVMIVAPINTAPLDLATACYALTSPGFWRRLCYQTTYAFNGANGAYPLREWLYTKPVFDKWVVDNIAADPKNTLYLPAVRTADMFSATLTSAKWVDEQVQRFSNLRETEYA